MASSLSGAGSCQSKLLALIHRIWKGPAGEAARREERIAQTEKGLREKLLGIAAPQVAAGPHRAVAHSVPTHGGWPPGLWN